jgi:membrane protease YdiL (CAAX protease family)
MGGAGAATWKLDHRMAGHQFVFQIADVALVASGTLLSIVAAVVLSVRRRWRDTFSLPSAPSNRLELFDLFLGLLVVFFLPVVVAQFLSSPNPAAETQPPKASQPQVFVDTVSKSLAVFILLALGRSRFAGGLAGWGLTGRRLPRLFFQAFLGFLVACPVCYGLLELSGVTLKWLGVDYEQHVSIVTLLDPSTPLSLRALLIVNALVLASLVEELVFRGLLIPGMVRWGLGSWAAVLLSSVLFGLIHYPYLDTVAPLVAFGVLLGYLYTKTGSLTLVILVHALFNGKTLLWLALGAK